MIEMRTPNCEVIAMYYPRLRDLREEGEEPTEEELRSAAETLARAERNMAEGG